MGSGEWGRVDSGVSPHFSRDTCSLPGMVMGSGVNSELNPHFPRDTWFPDCHGEGVGVGWAAASLQFPINICHLIFLFCLLGGLDDLDVKAEMFLEYSSRAPQPHKTSAEE